MQKQSTTTFIKWKPIEDFPEYSISNNGMVKKGNTLQNLVKGKNGYLYVYVRKVEMGVDVFNKKHIHRLVWDHFGNEPHKRNFEIHHKDENPLNNHIDNLELLVKSVHKKYHFDRRGGLKNKAA